MCVGKRPKTYSKASLLRTGIQFLSWKHIFIKREKQRRWREVNYCSVNIVLVMFTTSRNASRHHGGNMKGGGSFQDWRQTNISLREQFSTAWTQLFITIFFIFWRSSMSGSICGYRFRHVSLLEWITIFCTILHLTTIHKLIILKLNLEI